MDSIAQAYFNGLSNVLIENALAQPQIVVHRDFHSRNVMRLADGDVAVIDFQDAVVGPLTYDPVSLLKDCYIGWSRNRQTQLLDQYRNQLMEAGVIPLISNETLVLWYDLMGLQRHLKVLGQFARLHLRDGRSEYLNDLPMTLTYVRDIMTRYGGVIHEVGAFDVWVETTVMPAAQAQDWFKRMRLPKKVEKEPLLP
jgi:aminoglycoside/choline kinase family phosphotransferase